MGLGYYYTFEAPSECSGTELTNFLKQVENEAQRMGFHPTFVFNAVFDTVERRAFTRRLTTGLVVEDERLKSAALPPDTAAWQHDPCEGSCHLLPNSGALLVVTDKQGCETLFGFFKYQDVVKDVDGRVVAETGLAGQWHLSQFVDSPDPRFRKLVRLFANAGYLEREKDEFNINALTHSA
jgi:hypothetical protein